MALSYFSATSLYHFPMLRQLLVLEILGIFYSFLTYTPPLLVMGKQAILIDLSIGEGR
ncbi:hypothetical protein [Bartonella sp. AU55XJBT]|uniref:hypothetical protein n=1 Tax=Bartonella sp. AU55XJBT TaxID=3019091 RepID=UPI002360D86E|nr:hypothetical protein [Bartonella sp. AU55XJBT]